MVHDDQSGVRAHISDAEWKIRCDLAALYRLAAMFGWDDLIFTHISARVAAKDSLVKQPDGSYAPSPCCAAASHRRKPSGS